VTFAGVGLTYAGHVGGGNPAEEKPVCVITLTVNDPDVNDPDG
jgi:hypothetical protein